MTEPKPEKQKKPASPGEETPEADETNTLPPDEVFFNRVQKVLSKPVHPSVAKEIVVDMEGEGDR
jgi:hypothetical protein